MNPPEPSAGRWWERHPALLTFVLALTALFIGVLVLIWHLATSSGADGAHGAPGDIVFFGVIATVLMLAAGLTIARQRRS